MSNQEKHGCSCSGIWWQEWKVACLLLAGLLLHSILHILIHVASCYQPDCSVVVAKKLHNWSYLLVNTHSEKNPSVIVITHLVITEGGAKITKPAGIITKLRSQSTWISQIHGKSTNISQMQNTEVLQDLLKLLYLELLLLSVSSCYQARHELCEWKL